MSSTFVYQHDKRHSGSEQHAQDSCLLVASMASLVAQIVKNLPAMWEAWVRSLSWEDTLEKGTSYPPQYSGLKNSMD